MTAIEIAWLSLLTLVASWFGNLAVTNRVFRFLNRIGPSVAEVGQLASMVVFLLGHVAGAIVLAVYVSLGAAIIALSVASLVWGLFSYFLLQRFAGPLERPGLVRASPLFLPLASLASFVSTSLAFLLYTQWYFAFVPLLIWLVLGFITAEMAIRRYIKDSRNDGEECDRGLAMYAVNDAQGRGRSALSLLVGPVRYPFP